MDRKKRFNESQPSRTWHRVLLASFAVIFLASGAGLTMTGVLSSGSNEFIAGTLLKVGFVLGLVWLAAPQLERFGWQNLRGTLLIATILVLVLWAIRPRIGAVAGAILVGGSLAFTLVGWVRKLGNPPGK